MPDAKLPALLQQPTKTNKQQNNYMCLAMYKPADVTPDWAALENAMCANSDGAGFAVAKDGQLLIEKGFFKFPDFKKAMELYADCPAIIHFRLATHGAKNKANCHPFALADFGGDQLPVAVIHNGIFSSAANDKKEWSDTWHVCRDVLHPLWVANPLCFMHEAMKKLGDGFVGYSNKLVFLSANGDVGIWGENNGHWADKCWWSNHSYESYTSRYGIPMSRGTSYVATRWDSDQRCWVDATGNRVDFFGEEGDGSFVARSGYTPGSRYGTGRSAWQRSVPLTAAEAEEERKRIAAERAAEAKTFTEDDIEFIDEEERYEDDCLEALQTFTDANYRGRVVLREVMDTGVYTAAELFDAWNEMMPLDTNIRALEDLLAQAYQCGVVDLAEWLDREAYKMEQEDIRQELIEELNTCSLQP